MPELSDAVDFTKDPNARIKEKLNVSKGKPVLFTSKDIPPLLFTFYQFNSGRKARGNIRIVSKEISVPKGSIEGWTNIDALNAFYLQNPGSFELNSNIQRFDDLAEKGRTLYIVSRAYTGREILKALKEDKYTEGYFGRNPEDLPISISQ